MRSAFALWKLAIVTAFLNVFVAGIKFGQERWWSAAMWLGISAAMLAGAYFTRRRQSGLPGDP